MIERKTFAMEEASLDGAGILKGYGAHFDNEDDGGDTIVKGFFEPVIDDFLREGFISWGHDWNDPIAMPRAAYEDEKGLHIETAFHSTPRAQDARTIASERLAEGKTIGLSIGFETAEAKDAGPRKRILVKAKRLFEVGLVMVPMNRLAIATSVKGLPVPEMPFAERAELVAAHVEALMEHGRKHAEMRGERGFSDETRERLARSLKAREALDDIEALLRATDPDTKVAKTFAMHARALMAQARAEYDFN